MSPVVTVVYSVSSGGSASFHFAAIRAVTSAPVLAPASTSTSSPRSSIRYLSAPTAKAPFDPPPLTTRALEVAMVFSGEGRGEPMSRARRDRRPLARMHSERPAHHDHVLAAIDAG